MAIAEAPNTDLLEGSALAARRIRLRIQQLTIAHRLGVSPQRVSAIEHMPRVPAGAATKYLAVLAELTARPGEA